MSLFYITFSFYSSTGFSYCSKPMLTTTLGNQLAIHMYCMYIVIVCVYMEVSKFIFLDMLSVAVNHYLRPMHRFSISNQSIIDFMFRYF